MATNVTGQEVVFNHKTTRVTALSSTQKNVIYFTTDGHIVLDNRDYTPEYQPLINAENKLSYSLISGLGTAAGKGFSYEIGGEDYDNMLPLASAVKAYVTANNDGFARYLGHVYNDREVDALTEKANPGDYVVAVSAFTLNEESVAMYDLIRCVPVPLPNTGPGTNVWGKGWKVFPRLGGGESSGSGSGSGLYWD